MNNHMNKLTAVFKIATDILLVKNPVGTSMGLLFGVIAHGIASLFAPVIELTWALRLSVLKIYHFMAIGVFGFNIKSLNAKNKIPPDVEEAIQMVDKLEKQGKISMSQATLYYREITNRVIENVKLNNNAEIQAELFREILKKQVEST